MNRYRTYGQLDDTPEILGDATFAGLDMLTDPAALAEGILAVSENMRFDANGATVRAGMSRQFPAGTQPLKIYGAAVFKPTAAEDKFALVTNSFLVIFNLTDQSFEYYGYPTGETVESTDSVDLLQAGVGAGTLPQLFILRGQNKTVLKYDANANSITVATGFAQGDFGLFYQDRIAVGQGQDVPVSDFLNFTSFNILNQFQVLKGGDDYLRAFVPYQKDYVLIGTRQRWFIAFFDPVISATIGYEGGLQDNSFMRQLTAEAGPVGPKAALEAMGLIWFITDNAIYAFAPQLDNQLTVLGKPISAPIQPIMDRMCVPYASRACVERYGYRLYFALPISDEPLPVASITVIPKTTYGLILPFTLPAVLSTDSVAEITTAAEHNLAVGDRVQFGGAVSPGLNGEFGVLSVTDNFNFSVRLNITGTASSGTRMTIQKLATRNNRIAVYNLNNRQWESVDVLPAGFYADWLRPVEHAATRRLMLVDADAGPFIYEGSTQDEIGDESGGIRLPFTLPVTLSAINFASSPVVGRLRSRSYRWGAQPRKITRAQARATLDDDSNVTLNLLARMPNYQLWSASRAFTRSQFKVADAPLQKLCGARALEAQIEITSSGGQPTIRSLVVETVAAGRVEQ